MYNDIKISGFGNIPGGDYGEVKISGSANLAGSLRCKEFSSAGSVKGSGEIAAAKEFKVAGSMDISGSVSAAEIKISGTAKVKGAMTAHREFKVAGSLVADSVKSSELKVAGKLDTGSIEGDYVKFTGSVKCSGLVNADTLRIELDRGSSQLGAIGGGSVSVYFDKVQRLSSMPILSMIAGGGRLVVEDAIEADNIAIENTRAKRVTGRVVAVGDGCEIELLQYTDRCEVHPGAKIGEMQRI